MIFEIGVAQKAYKKVGFGKESDKTRFQYKHY